MNVVNVTMCQHYPAELEFYYLDEGVYDCQKSCHPIATLLKLNPTK
jgi:hypothetical protein